MSTYVIGDVHGCLEGVFSLLEAIDYNPDTDQLFFLGDIVNKGPNSLGMIKWIMSQNNCKTILGNHDLYVLHNVLNDNPDASETVKQIIEHDNSVVWLAEQPLIIEQGDHLFCHAGIHPKWNDKTIADIIANQQSLLTKNMLSNYFKQKSTDLAPDFNNPLFILASLTEMRFLDIHDFSLAAGSEDNIHLASDKIAWFDVDTVNHTKKQIYFGHWARLSGINHHFTTCLDGGYVYGGELLCKRIEDGKLFKVKNPKQKI